MPGAAQMHATTTTQLSNHSSAEKSKHRVFGHIFAMALVAVGVLAADAAWVALLALLWQILTRDRRSRIPKSVFL
jgi:hypothetical protein